MKYTKQVVQLGISGFPFGMAAIEKARLIALGLIESGINVTFVCRKGIYDLKNDGIDLKPKGTYEGIKYIYASGSVYRPKSFAKRNFLKIKGMMNEILVLREMSKNASITALVHSMDFSSFLWYWILSNFLGFKFIYPYVELNSSLPQRKKLYSHRIGDYLLENIGLKLPDGILPISDRLIQILDQKANTVPYLKIPVICDFDSFKNVSVQPTDDYFLFCGSAVYHEVISFILEAFDRLCNCNYSLYLIVSGDPKDLEKVMARINQLNSRKKVQVFSKIPKKDLLQKYVNARGLLIPLRNIEQDKARFPHKIGEYLASGNPIITTNIGEVKHYLKDGITALICENYSVEEFTSKMQFLISNPEIGKMIGNNGKEFGQKNFDIKIHGERLANFIQQIAK